MLFRRLCSGVLVSALGFLAVEFARAEPAPDRVGIQIQSRKVLNRISPDFIGFGYESSAVAQPGFFCATNRAMIQLYHNLCARGLIRIGGNVSDHTRFVPDGIAAPKTESEVTIVNRACLQNLGEFARATGWQVMWGLNLGSGTREEAVREAVAVDAALGPNLHSFEIGNEVDALRRFSKAYAAYHAAYLDYKAAIRAVLPQAAFSGPDVIGNWDWITNFVRTEAADLRLLTQHYYRGGAREPASTLEKLLQPDTAWDRRLEQLQQVCREHHLAFRINEVNSFYGGGKAGVSDTFGSALWCLDYMFRLASFACAGVNLETDVNQLGWLSHYSPIVHDEAGHCRARPEYYGMLAFALAGHGELLGLTLGSTNLNLSAYATRDDHGFLWLTVVNKEFSGAVRLEVKVPERYGRAEAFRLTAPSVESKEAVTFAGAEVAQDGTWTPAAAEKCVVKKGIVSVELPSGSAVVLRLWRR